jgi:hypothetical protein
MKNFKNKIKEFYGRTKLKIYFWLFYKFKIMTEEALKRVLETYADDPFNNYYCFESFTEEKKDIKNFLMGRLIEAYSTIDHSDIIIVNEIKLSRINSLENVNRQFFKNYGIEKLLHNFKNKKIELQYFYIFKINKKVLTRLP